MDKVASIWWKAAVALIGVSLSTTTYTTASVGVLQYNFTIIDNPAADPTVGERTRAFGINGAGHIVGDFGRHGFLYAGGVYNTVDVPGADFTSVFAVNDNGEMVGRFGDETGIHGFLYSSGVFTTIDVSGEGVTGTVGATRAYGINTTGQIVGDFDSSTGTHGYVYNNGVFTVIDFPGGYSTSAFGINDTGTIVGNMSFPNVGGSSAFIYERGAFSRLDNPIASSPTGSLVTVALAINNKNEIVGFFTDMGAYRAFRYDRGVFTTVALAPGADNQNFAHGINDAGRIVGYFADTTGIHGFIGNPTRRQ
jgi:probable HAF family extracellular repeat protein